MFTYKFFPHKSGKLWLRLRNNSVKTEISTGMETTENEFIVATTTPKGRHSRVGAFINHNIAVLTNIRNQLAFEDRADEDVRVIRDMYLEYMGKKKPGGSRDKFLTWFEKFLETKKKNGTQEVYRNTLKKIDAFDKNAAKLKFSDINVGWLRRFEDFCALTCKKNSCNIHLRNIRAVFNYAIDNEATNLYPFRRYKIRPEATRNRDLSVKELRKLFNYAVEPYAEFYRDMFKLIFMFIGINSVDLFNLKSIRNGRIEYTRAKTGTYYSIKVEPEAMEIIDKYRGEKNLLNIADRWSDHKNFRHQCNKALQKIGEIRRTGLGGKKSVVALWPELTTYWARHSWSTIAYNDLGISKDVIAQALGHVDEHRVTNIYINPKHDKVDEANRKVLDWVLYGKR